MMRFFTVTDAYPLYELLIEHALLGERQLRRLAAPVSVLAKRRLVVAHVISETVLDAYDALVATHPDVERKGAATPYTSMNGHMFSFLTPDGTLALRLSAADREAFVEK